MREKTKNVIVCSPSDALAALHGTDQRGCKVSVVKCSWQTISSNSSDDFKRFKDDFKANIQDATQITIASYSKDLNTGYCAAGGRMNRARCKTFATFVELIKKMTRDEVEKSNFSKVSKRGLYRMIAVMPPSVPEVMYCTLQHKHSKTQQQDTDHRFSIIRDFWFPLKELKDKMLVCLDPFIMGKIFTEAKEKRCNLYIKLLAYVNSGAYLHRRGRDTPLSALQRRSVKHAYEALRYSLYEDPKQMLKLILGNLHITRNNRLSYLKGEEQQQRQDEARLRNRKERDDNERPIERATVRVEAVERAKQAADRAAARAEADERAKKARSIRFKDNRTRSQSPKQSEKPSRKRRLSMRDPSPQKEPSAEKDVPAEASTSYEQPAKQKKTVNKGKAKKPATTRVTKKPISKEICSSSEDSESETSSDSSRSVSPERSRSNSRSRSRERSNSVRSDSAPHGDTEKNNRSPSPTGSNVTEDPPTIRVGRSKSRSPEGSRSRSNSVERNEVELEESGISQVISYKINKYN